MILTKIIGKYVWKYVASAVVSAVAGYAVTKGMEMTKRSFNKRMPKKYKI
ncbi:MAG: hypothetical protein ACPK7O_06320 [Methanobacterium sp.]